MVPTFFPSLGFSGFLTKNSVQNPIDNEMCKLDIFSSLVSARNHIMVVNYSDEHISQYYSRTGNKGEKEETSYNGIGILEFVDRNVTS